MKRGFVHKKRLGQHFLMDDVIAQQIVDSLDCNNVDTIVEIGPGQGALTKWLVPKYTKQMFLIEKDACLIDDLKRKYSAHHVQVVHKDFLQWSLPSYLMGDIVMIGIKSAGLKVLPVTFSKSSM